MTTFVIFRNWLCFAICLLLISIPHGLHAQALSGITGTVADASGAVKLVIVQADAQRPVTATLLADPSVALLRDALTGESIAVRDGRVTLAITGARVLVVS